MTLNNTKSTKIFLYFLVSILYFSCENSVDTDAPITTLLILQNPLNFGNQHPFHSEQKDILLKNVGETLNLSAQITGINKSEFSIINTTGPFIIKPGELVKMTIQFLPQDTGYRSAQLQLVSERGKSIVELLGNGYLYGFGHERIKIEVIGPHIEKVNDSILAVPSYSIVFLNYYDNLKLSWSGNKFFYSYVMSSNGHKESYSISGELSFAGDTIKTLNYGGSSDFYSTGRLNTHFQTFFSLFNIPYSPDNTNTLYLILGKALNDHINISRQTIIYNITDGSISSKSEYISSQWNDSSYIQVEFY